MKAETIQNDPIAFSISDDDLCASCRHCAYVPGELSLCKLQRFDAQKVFVGNKDENGYVISCNEYTKLKKGQSNWCLE